MLDKLWDDVVAGPQPERGLEKLRRNMTINTKDLGGEGSSSMRGSQPMTPTTPTTPTSARKVEKVWRSVFHPGTNHATRTIGADVFDKPLPNSPTVYDWLYSEESRSKHR